MRTVTIFLLGLILCISPVAFAVEDQPATKVKEHKLLGILSDELAYTLDNLATEDGKTPYYLAYTITDTTSVAIRGRLGALFGDDRNRERLLDVDVRVGDYAVDSTRQLRGRGAGRGMGRMFGGAATVSLEDSEAAIRNAVWRATDSAFKSAVERYQQVLTNMKTMVDEGSTVDDFSREEPSTYIGAEVSITLDRDKWADRIRKVSALALEYPLIHDSSISLSVSAVNRYMVSSEGTRLQTGQKLLRVSVSAGTKADDGMDLSQGFIFDAATEDGLPSEEELRAAFQGVIDQVLALREAPLVEPYVGPAILLNRASGVFFHEIFGHRIEGHRQKDVEEGQTFTKMIGKPVLPEFVSVCDDPTLPRFGDRDLRGFYRYDDEGIPASRVDLVKNGILNTFLMSRSPVEGFANSNGHGRRQPGRPAVSRQGNLIIQSERAVEFAKLREMLVEECKKQGKPFGFLFEDITGGFTTTSRSGPQAFKVLPVVVFRVYADGRPDELVRGVDIVGTPLSCFSKILCTGDDPAVFNGSCGAESGWVPVSAVSPSILVEQIEIEKRQRSQEKPPILPSPVAGQGEEAAASDDVSKDAIMNALETELARSMTLQIEDLEKPYFVQYGVDDSSSLRMSATCGAIVESDTNRSRRLAAQVRVGSYELDNTNFSGGGGFGRRGMGRGRGMPGGGGASLPVDDNELAIRQAVWRATDAQYKSAVETLAQKRAYMKDRDFEDRPADFSREEAVQSIAPRVEMPELDTTRLEDGLRRISARFLDHAAVVSSGATLTVGAGNRYLVNSEGTRLRSGKVRAQLRITAQVQGDDGSKLSDGLTYIADNIEDLPRPEDVIADVDDLVGRLTKAVNASVLEDYMGPVLFDGESAAQVFNALLARGVAATPGQVGGGRRRFSAMESLEKYLGRRILPRPFRVYDDPTVEKVGSTVLAGSFAHDDEGVPAQRVDLVDGGKLKDMLTSRTPVKSFTQSNGHGRRGGRSGSQASAACLFIETDGGLPAEDVKQSLLDAARDQGLDYALRVTSLRGGMGGGMSFGGSMADMRAMFQRMQRGEGGSPVGDPILIYKVHVEDGREEPVRGCEFGSFELRDLEDIIAAGNTPAVYNRGGGTSSGVSVVAPSVILEELELFAIDQELEKKPYIAAPHAR